MQLQRANYYLSHILGRALEAIMTDGDLFSKLSRYESRLLRELERLLALLRKAQGEGASVSKLLKRED
jgi:hypothetical protein